MRESWVNEFNLGMMVSDISPRDSWLNRLTGASGALWLEKPFLPELILLKAKTRFVEDNALVDSQFTDSLSMLLRWINAQDREYYETLARERGRSVGPLFLNDASRRTIAAQIDNLDGYRIIPFADFMLSMFLTKAAHALADAKLIRPLKLLTR